MREGEKDVQQDDVRNLLRRGCGEGYAEVAFVGIDGGVYTARWMVRRARGRADGNLLPSEHSLFRGNVFRGENGEQAAVGTSTQVKKAIVAKVGLNFDQFRRAVVLAQGDFATFLKAKDTERAEILQALTGTEHFERISKAVYERNKAEDATLSELRARLGAAVPLSEEARAQALEEIRRAEALCADIENQLKERRKQEEWFAVDAVRQKALHEARVRVSECLEQVESNAPRARELQWVQTALIEAGPRRQTEQELEAKLHSSVLRSNKLREEERKLVNALELAKEVHDTASKALVEATKRQQDAVVDIAKARALDAELSPLQEALELAQNEEKIANEVFIKAEKDLSLLNGELEQSGKEKQALQKRIAKVSPFEPFAADAGAWLERFKAEAGILKKTENAKRELEFSKSAAAQSLQNLQRISGKLPALREQRATAEKTLGEALRKAESFNAEKIVSKRRNAMDLRDALAALKSHLEIQKRVLEEQAEHEASLQTLEAQIAADGVLQEDLRSVKIPAAQAAFDTAQEGLRLAEFAASDQALVLREALIAGEACPVCGSCEHPNADGGNAVEKKMLAALKKSLRDKESTLQQLKADLSGLETVFHDRNKQVAETKRALKELSVQIKDLGGYRPAAGECTDVWRMLGEQRDAELKRREEQTAELLKSLDQNEDARLKAEKDLRALQAEFDNKQNTLAAEESAEKEARNLNENAVAGCSKKEADLAALEAELAAAFGEIRPVLEALKRSVEKTAGQDVEFLSFEYEADRKAYGEWFERGAREWNLCSPQLASLCLAEASKIEQLAPLSEAREQAHRALTARADAQLKALGRVKQKQQSRSALLGGNSVDEFERKIQDALGTASHGEAVARQKAAECAQALGSHRALLEEHATNAASLEVQWNTAKANVDAWLSEFGLREGRALNREALDVWLARDVRWIESERRSLKEAEDRLASARGQEDTIQKQLDEHRQARSNPDGLETVQSEAARLAAEAAEAVEARDAKRLVIVKDDERTRNRAN